MEVNPEDVLFIFLSILILVLLYNLLISSNGYEERENLMDENTELSLRNGTLRDSNEELRFEIINAQDNKSSPFLRVKFKSFNAKF